MMSMIMESMKSEVYHPKGRDRRGRNRFVKAAFDFVLVRDSEATEQWSWYCQPVSGSPDADPNTLAAVNEPASCRDLMPYCSGERMVMAEELFGNPEDDTLQACHFFGQV